MSNDDRLAALERKLHYLQDRQEILDCIVRNARGNDRLDAELTSSSYHPDGFHELGRNAIAAPEYGEFANHAHAAMCEQALHHVTMHSCEIDGNTAHAETYVLGLFLDKGAKTSRMSSGRYIDRLEKRGGAWRITIRRTTAEVVMEGSAVMVEGLRKAGYLKGSRDRNDLSYVRPLGLEKGQRWAE